MLTALPPSPGRLDALIKGETEFLRGLHFDLHVKPQEFESWQASLYAFTSTMPRFMPTSPLLPLTPLPAAAAAAVAPTTCSCRCGAGGGGGGLPPLLSRKRTWPFDLDPSPPPLVADVHQTRKRMAYATVASPAVNPLPPPAPRRWMVAPLRRSSSSSSSSSAAASRPPPLPATGLNLYSLATAPPYATSPAFTPAPVPAMVPAPVRSVAAAAAAASVMNTFWPWPWSAAVPPPTTHPTFLATTATTWRSSLALPTVERPTWWLTTTAA